MTILGIDPGYAITGYGVVESAPGKLALKDFGTINTSKEMPAEERLRLIHSGAEELMRRFQPDAVAVEKLFFNTNVTTALAVGEARGVILLAAVQCGLPVFEYTPLQVKMAVVGYGKAEKGQVQYMVKNMLKMKEAPKPDDAADALAVAICHSSSAALAEKVR